MAERKNTGSIRRGFVTGLMILICFVLQCTIFKTFSIGNISPNLMVILASSFGFMRGKKQGLFVGFFCGLLEDIFYGRLLGMHAMMYMYIGYVNGYFNHIFYRDDIKLPIFLISVSELVYGLGTYVIMFLMRSRFDFPYYLTRIILPELVYTIMITLVLYRIIYSIDRKMDSGEPS